MRAVQVTAAAAILVGILTGCASTGTREASSGNGALTSVSAMHSEMNLRLKMMLTDNAEACSDKECAARREFDQRVMRIGDKLSRTAMMRYPELKDRFEHFNFSVSDTAECGMASSDAGSIVVMRGVDRLNLDDAGLAYVMAREMAHVIVGHHEDNTMTSLAISLVAQIVMPMLNVARGAAAAVATKTAATSAVTSVAAMAGSKAAVSSQRPEQLQEAETVGLELMADAGFSVVKAIQSLQARVGKPRFLVRAEDAWVLELRESLPRVDTLVATYGGKPGNAIRLAAVSRDITQSQSRIASGADPSKVTEASAARSPSRSIPDDYLTGAEDTVSPEPIRRSALRAKRTGAASSSGYWGLSGYSDKIEATPHTESANAKEPAGSSSAKLVEPREGGAKEGVAKPTVVGHWGPWGYSERMVSENGEEGAIVKTVSAEQAKTAKKLAEEPEKYVRIPSATPKKDRLVPQGYWGTWGYGP